MMNEKSNSRSEFFADQLVDNCFRCGIGGFSFNTQPVGRKVINKNECVAFFRMFREKAALAIAGQFWRIFCVVFIKSVIFFFSKIWHKLLLYFKQFSVFIGTLHSMKYLYCLLINYIIHFFQ